MITGDHPLTAAAVAGQLGLVSLPDGLPDCVLIGSDLSRLSDANLIEAAHRTEAWCGEPFLQPDEDAAVALAPGTARRAALDDALAEMAAGCDSPSYDWIVRYGLMLGLERVLREDQPRTAAGTELRRHQVDALAGMPTALIASTQRSADESGNGNGGGNGAVAEVELEDDEPEDDLDAGFAEDEDLEEPDEDTDTGAVRRYRFRHPTASGKTESTLAEIARGADPLGELAEIVAWRHSLNRNDARYFPQSLERLLTGWQAALDRARRDKAPQERSIFDKELEPIEKLGYQPNLAARRLRANTSDVLGLIVSDIENPFFTSVVRGVEDTAQAAQKSIILCNSDENPTKLKNYLKIMEAERVAGLIVAPTSMNDGESLQRLTQAGIPIVLLDRQVDNYVFDSVLVDNIRGAFTGVKHLVDLGCEQGCLQEAR